MTKVSEYSIDLAHELCVAAARAGFTPEELCRLSQNENLMCDVRQVLLGRGSIHVQGHVIDCNRKPYLPKGWTLKEHQRGGQFHWDPSKISLWPSKDQKNSVGRALKEIKEELKNEPVLNACVLDYLLTFPNLIPHCWKGQRVFFFGTIYSNRENGYIDSAVRYLRWFDDGNEWGWNRLGFWAAGVNWLEDYSAAVLAS